MSGVQVAHTGLGGRRGAVCFVDAERDQYVRLHCESDVFSVRLQNQVCQLPGTTVQII